MLKIILRCYYDRKNHEKKDNQMFGGQCQRKSIVHPNATPSPVLDDLFACESKHETVASWFPFFSIKNIEENIYTCYFVQIIGLGISSVLIVVYFLISYDIMHKNLPTSYA